jgi:hypothetical protein
MVKATLTGCPSFNCTISDLTSFCQPPNSRTGAPGLGCKNAQGPSAVATSGTRAFSSRCPGAYSYSRDDSAATIGSCKSGSNYEVVFCPWQSAQGLAMAIAICAVGIENLRNLFLAQNWI